MELHNSSGQVPRVARYLITYSTFRGPTTGRASEHLLKSTRSWEFKGLPKKAVTLGAACLKHASCAFDRSWLQTLAKCKISAVELPVPRDMQLNILSTPSVLSQNVWKCPNPAWLQLNPRQLRCQASQASWPHLARLESIILGVIYAILILHWWSLHIPAICLGIEDSLSA